jgi:excisionase family DNA binding protein
MPRTRNTDPAYGTASQAAKLANVSVSTPRAWLRRGLISGIRVGEGAYLYNLADVAAMRVEYPRADADDAIRELVEGAPAFSAAQINKLRILLHATPNRGGDNDGA